MVNVVNITCVGSDDERAELTAEVEHATFERQPGFKAATPRRRATLHSDGIARFLFDAVSSHLGPVTDWPVSDRLRRLTPPLDRWVFVGVDPFIRVYRYERGEAFSTHQDEERQLGPHRWTALTLLLYLPTTDRPLVGGETFVEEHRVLPEPWSITAFAHHSWHHGAEVISGTKTVLRSDIIITSNA